MNHKSLQKRKNTKKTPVLYILVHTNYKWSLQKRMYDAEKTLYTDNYFVRQYPEA